MSYTWQHIEFESGANPYICKSETEFNRIKRRCNKNEFEIKHLGGMFWMVYDKRNNADLFSDE